MRRNISAIFLFSLLVGGCAAYPAIIFDFSGTGDSKIGKLVAEYNYHTEKKISEKVDILLTEEKVNSSKNKIESLRNLGFSCEEARAPICSYHGIVRSRVDTGNGIDMPNNNIKQTFDIAVDYSKIPAEVKTSIDLKRNQ